MYHRFKGTVDSNLSIHLEKNYKFGNMKNLHYLYLNCFQNANWFYLGEKPYQCKLCNSSFAQRTSLNVHMNSHHKSDIPADSNKGKDYIQIDF